MVSLIKILSESLAPIPSPEMVTPLYYQSAVMMSELAKEINVAYLEKFLDKGAGRFAPYTQGSQSFTLYSGISPENETENTVFTVGSGTYLFELKLK